MHRGHLDSDWVEGLGFRVWGVESGGGGLSGRFEYMIVDGISGCARF